MRAQHVLGYRLTKDLFDNLFFWEFLKKSLNFVDQKYINTSYTEFPMVGENNVISATQKVWDFVGKPQKVFF